MQWGATLGSVIATTSANEHCGHSASSAMFFFKKNKKRKAPLRTHGFANGVPANFKVGGPTGVGEGGWGLSEVVCGLGRETPKHFFLCIGVEP